MYPVKNMDQSQKSEVEKNWKKADNTLNKGILGWISRMFFGTQTIYNFNNMLNTAQKYSTGANNLAQTGLPGKATVVSIQDTGMLVNYNPVVRLSLKVQPMYGAGFETTGDTTVSKIAIPRVGDEINIKYNPANQSEFIIA
jgi:hypothetical protein